MIDDIQSYSALLYKREKKTNVASQGFRYDDHRICNMSTMIEGLLAILQAFDGRFVIIKYVTGMQQMNGEYEYMIKNWMQWAANNFECKII